MSFRPSASRQRYEHYLRDIARRRAAGEFGTPVRHHGTVRPVGPRQRSFGQLFVEFLGLLKGQRGALAVSLAMLTVATVLKLAPPAATKLLVDNVLDGKPLPPWLAARWPGSADPWTMLVGVSLGVVVISVVESVIHLASRWRATLATKRVQAEVRRLAFEHAVRLPLHRVYQLKSGGVPSLLREDAGGVAELIFSMLYNPWRAIVQLTGSLIILAWVDWRLLVGSLALLPTVYFTHRTYISRIRPLYRDVRRQRQEVDSHATEVFGGMRVVRGFSRARSEASRFLRGVHLMARQELNVWWWTRAVEMVWATLLPLASATLLLYGGWRVLEGNLSLGDLMMFLAYLAMLLGPLATLANSATQFQSDLAGLDRVLDLLGEPREMPDVDDALERRPDEVAGQITLRDVSFRYPANTQWVLRDIDLDILPGQMIALVGPSGAGKTTLSNLVARFYDPTEGHVELDGVDLRQIALESYRGLLGIVEQDIFLFDGTVAENIGYAVRDATPQEIQQAAEVANAHEFIAALPDGYDTLIGERGVRLSGGQRQRLAIARAVLADPRILILDEATSNLDTESERLIQQSLMTLLAGRTSIVIAHRLSTIAHADLIVVLEQGVIVETGTHEELMASSVRYREMVRLQMGHAATV